MATFTGTVRQNDLEGGFFELECEDGSVYRLEGAGKLKAGQRVLIHGALETGGFGFQMTGPSIKVSKVESAR